MKCERNTCNFSMQFSWSLPNTAWCWCPVSCKNITFCIFKPTKLKTMTKPKSWLQKNLQIFFTMLIIISKWSRSSNREMGLIVSRSMAHRYLGTSRLPAALTRFTKPLSTSDCSWNLLLIINFPFKNWIYWAEIISPKTAHHPLR